LIEKRHFHIIVAHIERFLRIPGNKPYVKELIQMPVTVQVNAETLLDFRQRSRMFKLFKKGKAHILGSDCHGMHHRRPNLWEGREALSGKFGTEILERIDRYGADLLQEHHR
jgi:protein-tyrosine phosphatase